MIDYVPPTEIKQLEKNKAISVFKRPATRVIFLVPDHERDRSPFITTKDGRPLDKNPLKDLRVRKAISMAIDRDAICKSLMEGLAIPASQLAAPGILGYNPDLKVDKYDPVQAKKLLAEAGYADGFGLTIHGPNNRFLNDAKISQAVGQMLSRIGISVKVETMPVAVFFSRAKAPLGEYSFSLTSWADSTGDFAAGLTALVCSYDRAKGTGSYNYGSGYSNPEIDKVMEIGRGTVDIAQREKLLQKAMAIAVGDLALIPLHIQFTAQATRKGIIWPPRADEGTRVMSAKPAP